VTMEIEPLVVETTFMKFMKLCTVLKTAVLQCMVRQFL